MAEKGVEVVVRFPDAVPLSIQGPFLLQAEQSLRASTGLDVRVVKALMGDDSQLRVRMTIEQRNKL